MSRENSDASNFLTSGTILGKGYLPTSYFCLLSANYNSLLSLVHCSLEMRAVNPPARPWTRILTLLLLFFYVCWLCQDCIQYYSILFVPSMCVQMFHPGPAKFDVRVYQQ